MTDQRRAFGCLIEAVETVVLTAIIFFVLQTFVAQPFQVEQVSMRDTIEPQQYVLVDKLTPRFDGYHRGDIIVFTPPNDSEQLGAGKPYIKRIVGVGGDTVQLRNGKVFVNGTQLNEPYLYAENGKTQPTTAHGDDSTWDVPQGDLFVMGDHRQQSQDSRDFGPIEVKSVLGRAWLRYWPAAAFGVLPTNAHTELTGTASPVSSPKAAASIKP